MSKPNLQKDDKQKLVDEFFDSNAAYWKDTYKGEDIDGIIYRWRQAVALSYIDGLQIKKSARVLEIGCGAGFVSTALAKRGYFVEAIDHAQAMVELTRKRAKEAGMEKHINSCVGDIHELSYEDRSFDLIVALGVIPWLHDFRKALAEIARVLSPGGYVVISMDNELRATTLFDPLTFPLFVRTRWLIRRKLEKAGLLNQKNPWSSAPPYSRHTIKDFNNSLREVGLTIMKGKSVGYGPFTFLGYPSFSGATGIKIQERLQGYADKGYPILRSAGSQYVVLATKKAPKPSS